MAHAFKESGYAGCVVTDHFFNGNTAADRSLPWAEKVAQYVSGYEACAEEGKKIGLDVFFGLEWAWHGAEFLTIGLTPQWLYENEDCDKWNVPQYASAVHKAGGILIHAHPYREASYIPRHILFPQCVDAVEVANGGHNEHPDYDRKALAYANQFGLPGTAGTDIHHVDGIQMMGIRLAHRVSSGKELAQCILRREFEIARSKDAMLQL